MKVQQVSIDAIKPYKNNPRKNDAAVDAVAASIEEFGFQQPIVCDMEGVVIAGHTRLKAAKKLGLDTVPVVYADLPEDKAKAYRLADNKTGELAEWDFDLLDIELSEIDMDMEPFGFELSGADENPTEAIEDDYDAEPPAEPKAKRGEIYQLGRHRLMCGDSTMIDDVEKLMGGAQADLFLTDPPYNVDYTGKTKDALKIQNDKKSDEDFRSFLSSAFFAAKHAMKAGAAFYIWHADSEGYNFRGACHDVGLVIKQCLVWVKNSMVLGRQDYQWKHEPCLYGWNDGAAHSWYSDRKQTTVLNFEKPQRSAEHPTMKPVPLFDYQIRNSTKAGDIVLDLFGGSGTTIIACEQNGRSGYLMELDPRYIDVIIDRWEKFTGEKAVLLSRAE